MAADDDVMTAYQEYLHEWLLAELEVNGSMTIDQVEGEFMPLIMAGDFVSFPAEMLFNGMLEQGCAMTYDEFAAQYDGAAAAPAASGEPSGEGSAEPAAEVVDAAGLKASSFSTLTNYTNRDDSGNILIGYAYVDGAASDEGNFSGETDLELSQEVSGEAYTAVFANNTDLNITGSVNVYDEGSGEMANDFNGIGTAIVAYNDSDVNVTDAEVTVDGFGRCAFISSQNSSIVVRDSVVSAVAPNVLTEVYDSYVNSANQNIMLSPPWVLGILGGSRVLNMIGQTPAFTMIDSEMVSGGWALLSTDSGSNMMINVVDSDLSMLPESEGGMDSGWRIFGYDEDAYGSGYGSYYIGNPTQNYYGATISGVTYCGIITGAQKGLYTSSEGSIELYDAEGNLIDTVEGKGEPTVINSVFGFMAHNSVNDGIYVEGGTVINSADATVIYKAANSSWFFDNAELNSGNGVLFQMIDNDDDSRVGMISMAAGFDTTYNEDKVGASEGFPGLTYDVSPKAGGNTVNVSYANGEYVGNLYNGTGYYGQSGDNLNVTLGEGAILEGDMALTSTIKGVPYSAEALEGIEYYGDDIGYVFLDAEGNVCEEADAAYIQIRSYTMNEYFLQGHVQNLAYYNGASSLSVTVEDGAEWTVAGESLLTKLSVAEGAVVYGELTENADGTLSLTASEKTVPAGEYGSIEAVGGGSTIGGGLDASGELNVEAAASAMNAQQTGASGEPSSDASGEPSAEPAAEAAEGFEVTINVNGDEVKTANVGIEQDGNTYKFQLNELLDVLGVTLSYDEETGIATVTAAEGSAFAAMMSEEEVPASAEPSAEPASVEPTAEEEAAAPATDGTENQGNVLAGASAPATAEEFNAYVEYCRAYMTAYDGVGDGTFDDSARAMALGELDGVSFGSDVNAFPFEMFVTAFGADDYATFAGGVAPAGGDVSEAAYQAYLIEFVNSCEDIQKSGAAQEFIDLINAGDYVTFPVEMLFDATWFGEAAMTFDAFVAAGGNVEVAEHPSNGAMLDGTGEEA